MYLSKEKRKWLLGALLAGGASFLILPAQAQEAASTAHSFHAQWPQASLSAEASAQVAQDTVKITLASELDGASQAKVADQLSKTLASVMQEVSGKSKVKASSGNFRVWPMNNDHGKISSWHGRGEIYLESTDLAAASELAAKVSDRMPIANLAFSVSAQARAKQEQALLAQAAQAFRERAKALTEAFGFASYTVRNVDLSGGGAHYAPAPRMMAMAADKAAVPLEGGTEMVTVSVRGSIFLHSAQK
ncbi:SIMPL domain-containing protein [Paralcaligenes sp. KSB-10]|uniref:SIMPL domain-containing protein n=1 Tax=Paralcaligenes sp. KSB-10 TaxID=2901142 RepID=UPI001E51FDE5|nr:SIMPL domain-containing protein [Paralcaligenes sp. KSB-10]UHL64341.1 SIMPL domain-containing protein [Paralcaligenes sp. KSB-10]